MLSGRDPCVAPFPRPSELLARHLEELSVAAALPPTSLDEMRRVASLPRPWDPPSCPPTLQRHIWIWLDEVAAWINAEHTWRVDRMIPICWAQHPHIVHELATVACLRYDAMLTFTAEALEDWHRYALPMFLNRIAERIGGYSCPPGTQQRSASCSSSRRRASDRSFDRTPSRKVARLPRSRHRVD